MIAFAQALDVAVAEGTLDRNLARDRTLKRPKVEAKAGFANLDYWPLDSHEQPVEMIRFRDAADEHSYAALWRLTLSGLTRADICGLRWSDLDLDAGTVTVSQGRIALQNNAFIEDAGGRSVVGKPKSAQRWRIIEPDLLHEGTTDLLRVLRARQAADRLAAGPAYDTSHDLILVDALGNPIRPELWSDWFRRLCETTEGVSRIHMHNVRHSLADWMDALGLPIAARAAFLGHSKEVHINTYLPSGTAAGIRAAMEAMGSSVRAAR